MRLVEGKREAATYYPGAPSEIARGFFSSGARRLHVVDLDAARSGTAANLGVIEAICAAVRVRVQSGGGVRSVLLLY